jgi:hypothetical protein
MGFRPFFFFLFFSIFMSGCVELLPEQIALAPGADHVEVISDPPNPDIYEPVGGVTARVAATEVSEAVRQAKNELRNQAAKKGATFVSIDEISSRASWDLRGRTIVAMTGTAFRQK